MEHLHPPPGAPATSRFRIGFLCGSVLNINALTVAIQDTIDIIIPLSKLVPHSHRWWNGELSEIQKERNRLNNQSYLHQAVADHPSHAELKEINKKYSEVIDKAKAQHYIKCDI